MTTLFKKGDAVSWNAEAGVIHGKVLKVHTQDVEFMGRQRHCSAQAPQYEVQSDKTGHLAMHKQSALSRL
ncbi:DUF2945 domain-containing protein [Pseudomonas syringae]|nr:DUF2945 domain-containing protein [Pseudomonas syringae]MBD8572826.1 DUF2945 domain-containing protein [Pseudomonas syringae]MBD8790601.1 DUF2945 domain-containing protein [Pseudomonas syringae]MBD8798838.1 DUF2945 domain-containing protein [Pseudomonas syringae]MBD8809665.1 DUF2945 domain-containing protein [Pseudomonas syringae]